MTCCWSDALFEKGLRLGDRLTRGEHGGWSDALFEKGLRPVDHPDSAEDSVGVMPCLKRD